MIKKKLNVEIRTFGCQMNFHDSEKMAGLLKSNGYAVTEDTKDADIIIFNTCSIREKAEQKFYSELGKIKSLKKRRPSLKIVVAGCIAQQEGQKILDRAPYVDYVIGPQNISFLNEIIESGSKIFTEENQNIGNINLPAERKNKVKAWVNIMYGCNNFCSYCVVPYTRGREISRDSQSIINEIKELSNQGCKEVTLLGQNVNSYKNDLNFPELLKEINKIKGIERIRFVTSHPKDLSDDVIYAIKELDKVCEHIHLPLQSGSSRILNLMNRKYTYDEYMHKIERLKKEIPEIAITSDIIAGFPQETDEDHMETIRALNSIEFDGIFAFKYSNRPNTKASKMDGQVPDKIKSERLNEILELQNIITERKNKKLEETFQEILIDEIDKNDIKGRTRQNKSVLIESDSKIQMGDIIRVKILKANRHSLQGVITL